MIACAYDAVHASVLAPNSFSQLPLPLWLVDRADSLGFTQPTAVQAAAVGPVCDGSDAIIIAQTGSGKTLAYLLPVLARIRPVGSVQALILAPSRELAAQVARVARRLAAGSPDRLLVMALLDGSGAKRQRIWIKAQPPQAAAARVSETRTRTPHPRAHLTLTRTHLAHTSHNSLTPRTPLIVSHTCSGLQD